MKTTTFEPIGTAASTNSTKTPATKLRYRADVDGLRAIAVLLVLFYHASIGCPGGFVGVDVFFVISGYLITGLILKEIYAGQFQIRKFYERRIRRIVPTLAVVLLSCLAAGWLLLPPTAYDGLGKSVIAQVLLSPNIYLWRTAGYFTAHAAYQPLLHTWSLGVEEQFYLLLPGLLVLLCRYSRRFLFPTVLSLCIASFCLSVYCGLRQPDFNFYLLPTRAWELGLGSLLAIIPAQFPIKKWLAETLSCIGLAMILCAAFLYNNDTIFPGVAALLPVVGTFLVIFANDHALTSTGKLLSLRPVVFIGLISYSLYLWHWPVLVFFNISRCWMPGSSPLGLRLLLLATSIIIASLSWRYIETPFRKRTVLKSRPQIFAFAALTTVVILLAGLSVHKMQGVPSRVNAAVIQYENGKTDLAFREEVTLKNALAGQFTELGASDKHQPVYLLVWGDSHAKSVLPTLNRLCRDYKVRGVAAAHSSTAPLINFQSNGRGALKEHSMAYNKAVLDFISRKHVKNVLLVGYWNGYIRRGGNVGRGLEETIDALKDTGTRIWIMKQVPLQNCAYPPMALAVAAMHHQEPKGLAISLEEERKKCRTESQIFKGLTAKFSNVTVLDPTLLLTDSKGICYLEKNGRSVYYDGYGHLTIAGATELCPLFRPIFDGDR